MIYLAIVLSVGIAFSIGASIGLVIGGLLARSDSPRPTPGPQHVTVYRRRARDRELAIG